jgi:hypothetical protein
VEGLGGGGGLEYDAAGAEVRGERMTMRGHRRHASVAEGWLGVEGGVLAATETWHPGG